MLLDLSPRFSIGERHSRVVVLQNHAHVSTVPLVRNVCLVHRLGNRVDYSKQIGRPHAKT